MATTRRVIGRIERAIISIDAGGQKPTTAIRLQIPGDHTFYKAEGILPLRKGDFIVASVDEKNAICALDVTSLREYETWRQTGREPDTSLTYVHR